ncbi:MAG: aspartyl protease family protein [Ignavibacteria bacterium]|nr:aspartyl protease family protein [Ignavibacteria bacterium]
MKYAILVIFLVLSPLCYSQSSVFLITLENGTPKIEKESIAKDETKVFICGGESGIISLVFPSGAGLSGDFVKLADKKVMIVRYVNDELIYSLKKDDGTLKQIIAAPVSDLPKNDYRINLVSNNVKKAFKISSYDLISEDMDSPVMNMFGDKITPKENEFIITTEIKEASQGFLEGGIGKIRFTGNYFLTEVKIGDKLCNFVVDLAAVNSFIVKKNVPSGIKTDDLIAKQYSADGMQVINSPVSGFGGSIKNLQTCVLPKVELGSVSLLLNTFYVIDTMFSIKGTEIDGILGMDILQRFEAVTFEIDSTKNVELLLGKCFDKNKHNAIELPYTIANGHIFVNGKIGSSDVDFIVDTGSPFSFIQSELAKNENIMGEKSFTVKGADGKEVTTMNAEVPEILLEQNTVLNFKTKIVDSPILSGMGLKNNGGLLGNSFFKNYKQLCIDFKDKKLILYK